MAKIRYNYDDNFGGPGYHKNSSGKGFKSFFWIIVIALVAWGIYKWAFGGKKTEKTPAIVEKTQKTPEKSEKKVPEKTAVPVKPAKVKPQNSVNDELEKDAVSYPLGKVELSQVPVLNNQQNNILFQKAVADTDYQTAKTLILKELSGMKSRSSLYFRTLGKYLRALNNKILFDGVPGGKNENYKVKSGDSLNRIAIHFNLPVTAIVKENKLKSTTIYPGQSLRIYKGDWKIEVSKSAKLLYVYDGKDLFAIFDIGIGREGRTPKGDFILTDKIEHPSWYAPDGRIVPYGEKENVLGTHWLKIEPAANTDPAYIGYGIHGTWDNGSITRSLSNGCIRMTNDEVAELFMYIPRKTPVKIY